MEGNSYMKVLQIGNIISLYLSNSIIPRTKVLLIPELEPLN